MDKFEALAKAADENFCRSENGKVIINMEIADIKEAFSGFTVPGKAMLSAEAAEFIENAAKGFATEEQFLLKVKGNFSSPEEKQLFCEASNQYFLQSYISAARELRRNRFHLAMLFGVGVFILGASYMFKREIWSEVGNIAAWVLIWRMVDLIAFENRDLISAKKRFRSLAETEIEFEK